MTIATTAITPAIVNMFLAGELELSALIENKMLEQIGSYRQ